MMNADPNQILKLLFNGSIVGFIKDAFQVDDTWNGRFILETVEPVDEAALHYIQECKRWNETLKSGEEVGDLYSQFPDVIGSERWWIVCPSERYPIEDAPVFFAGGDVSWLFVKP
jgi:hypothetical protein